MAKWLEWLMQVVVVLVRLIFAWYRSPCSIVLVGLMFIASLYIYIYTPYTQPTVLSTIRAARALALQGPKTQSVQTLCNLLSAHGDIETRAEKLASLLPPFRSHRAHPAAK